MTDAEKIQAGYIDTHHSAKPENDSLTEYYFKAGVALGRDLQHEKAQGLLEALEK